jgi:hypothetical protein
MLLSMPTLRIAAGFLSLLAGFACSGSAAAPEAPAPPAVTRVAADAVEFPATVQAAAFNRSLLGVGMPGYHAIVWKGGGAAGVALFRAEVSDTQLLDALEALGGKPGNALGMDSWEARKDPQNPEPDKEIQGPPVEILVRLPGRAAPVPLAALLDDPGGRGLDMRLGGHRANIPTWHSGCIACLYSCPGSKLGNARYTVRDYVRGATRFRAKTDLLPPDGTPVTILVRLLRNA